MSLCLGGLKPALKGNRRCGQNQRRARLNATWSEDWRRELRNRLKTVEALSRILELTPEELLALRQGTPVPVAITPYYASLIRSSAPDYPLRRAVVPHCRELETSPEEVSDPLGEQQHAPLPDVIHTYSDRLLLLVTDRCAVYCRFCTRRRLFTRKRPRGIDWWPRVLAYLRDHREIREVILSGGDPLMLDDSVLRRLLRDLRSVPHVEILRLHTRIPAVLPSRVTPALAELLREYQPLWLIHHTVHPDELTPRFAAACSILADHGIPMGNQTVLLKDINDEPETMLRLMNGLVRLRVKPYYLHQCDLAPGTSHFRTPVETGIRLIRRMYGRTGSLAVPLFVIDPPGGGGKVPLMPDYVVSRKDGAWYLTNYEGRLTVYCEAGSTRSLPDPAGAR